MYTVFNESPQNLSGRLQKEINCFNLLDKLNIKFTRVEHPAAENMAVCDEINKSLGCKICKNLLLCNRQETQFYLLMMPGDKQFKTKDLSAKLGVARLSFAKPCFMEEFLNITPGSLSVLGLMNDKENKVRLIVDKEVFDEEYVGCHPTVNTGSLKIKCSDVFTTFCNYVKHTYTLVDLARQEE